MHTEQALNQDRQRFEKSGESAGYDSLGFTDCSQVDSMGVRYKFVVFGFRKKWLPKGENSFD